jgi:hypothetical protein
MSEGIAPQFLTSLVDEIKSSDSPPEALLPGKEPPVHIGWKAPTGNRTPAVQPVACDYTDWAIPTDTQLHKTLIIMYSRSYYNRRLRAAPYWEKTKSCDNWAQLRLCRASFVPIQSDLGKNSWAGHTGTSGHCVWVVQGLRPTSKAKFIIWRCGEYRGYVEDRMINEYGAVGGMGKRGRLYIIASDLAVILS